MSEHYLECPCCGDDGAIANQEGGCADGQPLICGCSGWVSVDEDGDAWINNGDVPCPSGAKCREGEREDHVTIPGQS